MEKSLGESSCCSRCRLGRHLPAPKSNPAHGVRQVSLPMVGSVAHQGSAGERRHPSAPAIKAGGRLIGKRSVAWTAERGATTDPLAF
jgi:hypothetical protein